MNSNGFMLDKIGPLNILDIYEYYDEPVLFSCISPSGQYFLAVVINYEDDSETWLYLPMSFSRLYSLETCKLELYDAYKEPENGWLWKVKIFYVGRTESAQITPSDLIEDDLPEKGVYLLDEPQKSEETEYQIIKSAIEERRDVLNLSIKTHNNEHEIESNALGNFITHFQTFLYSLSHDASSIKGRIPISIKHKYTLMVSAFNPGSFSITFKSNDIANLLGKTSVSDILYNMMELMEIKNDQTKFKSVINKYSLNSGYKYKMLLSDINSIDASIVAKLAQPDKTTKQVCFTNSDIKSTLQMLESEVKSVIEVNEYEGDIVGINVSRNVFAFKSNEGENFFGTISDSLNGREYIVPKHIKAVIEETHDYNSITQKEKVCYKLLEIKEAFKTLN